MTPRIGIATVCYEAAATIAPLLDRVPTTICGARPIVLVADDASADRTEQVAKEWATRHAELDVRIERREHNLGYGGNQKACYRWAIAEGLDVVALLHGDGQYPPEMIEALVRPILDGRAEAVFGSRMLVKGDARRGGMPLVRLVGNRALNPVLNRLAAARLSEWFSGFRAYRVATLDVCRVERLPDGFDFDTAILFQLLRAGARIEEVPIPTRYAGEISRVPLARTGLSAIGHGMRRRPIVRR